MSIKNSTDKDIQKRFDERIEELKKTLPKNHGIGTNCAALTLNNILDIIGINNGRFHLNNLVIPLAAGFGGYKSKKGWQGACGAVCGACGTIGLIIGGKEKLKPEETQKAYFKASSFCTEFEKEFGSVVCTELSGYNMGDLKEVAEYQKNNTWEKKCNKFVIGAIDIVRKLVKNDLEKKWK